MSESESTPHHAVDEAAVVARITRYSSLRGVERALLPSVRRRVRLPTTHLGSAILTRLQALLELTRSAEAADPDAMQRSERELARVDEILAEFTSALATMVDDTPIAQLRSTLPPLLERARGEVGALLDLCLESFVPGRDDEPPFKIDYLVTLLSRQRVGDVSTLGTDPCAVTPGVTRLCAANDTDPDFRAPELARLFRDARIELLGADDLDEIIRRMRHVKGRLGPSLFDCDVLRAIVCYNIAAENRFRELFQLEHRRDAAIERTLHALAQLDGATPYAMAGADAQPTEAIATTPGLRALEEALRVHPMPEAPDGFDGTDAAPTRRPRLESRSHPRPTGDPDDVLTRAAVLVGLAQRELPSLTARLRELDIDVSQVETDWVRELDKALQAAIRALSKSGRPDEAARLARTRMRYLSGH